MQLDPNLEKICDANIETIVKNNFFIAIRHAKDYLNRIVSDPNKAKIELDNFIQHLKEVKNNAS